MELPITDKLVDRQRDALYNYDPNSQKDINVKRPWDQDPTYFKTVRVSSVALTKMVMHAREGGSIEVMGMMQGYVDGTTIVVTDAFRLPVEGTETRVNAQGEADEYLVNYLDLCRKESRLENIVGWYHSHPGYGCWLSGIDVETQKLQQLQGPMVAVVIDPNRTVSANKVEIGAFRTYPDWYTPPDQSGSTTGGSGPAGASTTVPLSKTMDYGAHANKYYRLEVEHFKSTLDTRLLDLLWNKYWVQTLAQNPLLSNRDYSSSNMDDVGQRLQEIAVNVSRMGKGMLHYHYLGSSSSLGGVNTNGPKAVDQSIEKAVQDVGQIAAKERAGLLAAEVKVQIFGQGEV